LRQVKPFLLKKEAKNFCSFGSAPGDAGPRQVKIAQEQKFLLLSFKK
jgi:hypothetical protein